MKVAIAFPGCHRRGGVERVVYECSRFLAGRGHDVTVLTHEWDELPSPEVKLLRIPGVSVPDFLKGWYFQRHSTAVLSGLEYDVLNSHGCVCPFGGVQWVQSVHAAWLEQSSIMRRPNMWPWWKQRLNPAHPVLLQLERRHFRERRYRHLIATTSRVREDLNRIYQVPEQDVTILPNGFAPEEFNPERRRTRRASAREKLGLKEKEVAFLFAVNELDRKGYPTLLAALSRIPANASKVVMVGRYNARDAMSQARAAGVADRIIFHPPSPDIAWYHAACDVFVLPTQYEAFCLAILESLGSGLPVITSGVPGARDALRDGVNGILVEDPRDSEGLASSMNRLLDPILRDRLANQAPATVNLHRWPSILTRFEDVLLDHTKGTVQY